ncbi:putative leucine-rich repeat domain, L domain-containing protein [Medicago truncatula]|uniref:Protein phosphatase 1 regulatory subunit SDS22 n=1 Tax=Medicago truncatula TaxID=3880 RepID=G7IHH7_MEDTR|nr:leucine-rich repeat-containing protein 9 [Medicago truncatula]AES67115.1 protein phosphatase 1 regulatory subunit SDS22 [Medicago truncatula]RHN75480.1 putative leucine-rich repeat domain, L domain-containing protein [Medicago truncatula]
MTRLSSEQVLKDNNAVNPSSISSLHLTHKALSDVSCLASFNKLEKLDLKFNNLTSLEGLRACVTLKWLSVVENKLESLEGIQGLTKLTVLNAGKNKLKSMDEIGSLSTIRALILNDNEIVSICNLDQMKELNTLVLSKNPIRKIGEALKKVKSITKLSLSHCQLEGIDTSLKFCVELTELRLAHNDIKSLPEELMHNSKLRNLDLGNNVIAKWSDIKVLKSLTKLRNLNLQGNPVATNEKVIRKIKNALPKLQVFNAKPIDKDTKNEKGHMTDDAHDFSFDHVDQNEDDHLEAADKRKSNKKRKETADASEKEAGVYDKENTGHNKDNGNKKKDKLTGTVDPDTKNKSTKKKLKKDDNKPSEKALALEENVNRTEKKKKNRKNKEQSEFDIIDDAEASFAEIFNIKDQENLNHGGEMKLQDQVPKDLKLVSSIETLPVKHKSAKMHNVESLSSPGTEIGMGGPSTWGD